jgi:hypothetical protein
MVLITQMMGELDGKARISGVKTGRRLCLCDGEIVCYVYQC